MKFRKNNKEIKLVQFELGQLFIVNDPAFYDENVIALIYDIDNHRFNLQKVHCIYYHPKETFEVDVWNETLESMIIERVVC